MQYLYRQFGDEDKAAEFYDEVVRAYNLDMPLNDPKTPAQRPGGGYGLREEAH